MTRSPVSIYLYPNKLREGLHKLRLLTRSRNHRFAGTAKLPGYDIRACGGIQHGPKYLLIYSIVIGAVTLLSTECLHCIINCSMILTLQWLLLVSEQRVGKLCVDGYILSRLTEIYQPSRWPKIPRLVDLEKGCYTIRFTTGNGFFRTHCIDQFVSSDAFVANLSSVTFGPPVSMQVYVTSAVHTSPMSQQSHLPFRAQICSYRCGHLRLQWPGRRHHLENASMGVATI